MSIVQIPDPVLFGKARLDFPGDRAWLRDTLTEMDTALQLSRGVGIAAPQIGLPYRIMMMRPTRGVRCFINPTFKPVEKSGRSTDREGCLSVDNGRRSVLLERWKEIVAEGIEVVNWHPNGRLKTKHFRGHLVNFEARVWQHECDHLDGILLGGTDLTKPPEVQPSSPGTPLGRADPAALALIAIALGGVR